MTISHDFLQIERIIEQSPNMEFGEFYDNPMESSNMNDFAEIYTKNMEFKPMKFHFGSCFLNIKHMKSLIS